MGFPCIEAKNMMNYQPVLKRDIVIHSSQRWYDIIDYHAYRKPDKRTEQ